MSSALLRLALLPVAPEHHFFTIRGQQVDADGPSDAAVRKHRLRRKLLRHAPSRAPTDRVRRWSARDQTGPLEPVGELACSELAPGGYPVLIAGEVERRAATAAGLLFEESER